MDDQLPSIQEEPKVYRAFILRWWQENGSQNSTACQWRFLMEDIHDKQSRIGFRSFSDLIQFIHSEIKKQEESTPIVDIFEPRNHIHEIDEY